MILLLFFLSGATALVYEVLWSKYLSLMFGSTVQAQTMVLSVFMGGLALGNFLFGRRSVVIKHPLLAYGYMELGIGIYAAGFDLLYRAADGLFVLLGTPLLHHSFMLLCLKAVLSTALLLPPTVLMGGTLPLLAGWLQRTSKESGRMSARFYSVNTLGAVFGAGLAGFYLVKTFGLVATALIAGLVNAIVGTIAIGLARREGITRAASVAETPALAPVPAATRACMLVAMTGGIAMGLEILASRGLSLIFGSSLQAFALVLMSFILGIGMGSTLIASPQLRRWNDHRFAVVLLLGAAVWVGLLIFRIENWVEFYRWAKTGLARTEVGYAYHQLLTSVMSLVVLGLPAALIGAVLPLMIRLAQSGNALGAEVGRLLTWNTLGAVVGVLLTGFVLMPLLGLRAAFAALGVALAMTALFYSWRNGRTALNIVAATTALVLLALATQDDQKWKFLFGSGVFRTRDLTYRPGLLEQRRKMVNLLFYRDAPDATVCVEQIKGMSEMTLLINGKADASAIGDYSTQILCAHLPMIARPQSTDVFILGLGSGITGAAALAHPIQRLVIAENCGPVIEAAQLFSGVNEGVLTNSIARILREDGRTALKLAPQRYDVIISEPSNPWTAGVGSVFSQEFYAIAASRLKPGGVIAQWFHVYEMQDAIVGMVLRTFSLVFPHCEVWDAGGGDIILLGGLEPWEVKVENFVEVLKRPSVNRQLKTIGVSQPAQLLARQLASQRTAFAIPDEGVVQSDFMPLLEYEAPRAFFIGARSTLLQVFDERTIQYPLLPEWKRRAIEVLSDESLRLIFADYRSVNPELMDFLAWRLTGYTNQTVNQGSVIPSVFRTSNAPPPTPNLSSNEVLKKIDVALEALRFAGGQPATLVKEVAGAFATADSILLARNAEKVALQARIAARYALGTGDYATTRTLLKIGLNADPDDEQLRYVTRILEREQPAVAPLSHASPGLLR